MTFNVDDYSLSELRKINEGLKNGSLQEQIQIKISSESKNSKYLIQSQFRSDRMPDFNQEYEKQCKQLQLEFDVFDLYLSWKAACFNYRNNSRGDFYKGMFGSFDTELDEKWRHNLGYLMMLFQSEQLKKDYEGVYNTLNYFVNGIYKVLNSCEGNVFDKKELFSDFSLRKEAVWDNFVDIVDYLWEVRESVPGSRLSISNQGLTKNRNKVVKKISKPQEAFIEAIAFGTTLDELEDKNYEGAKRLIFVPREKIK